MTERKKRESDDKMLPVAEVAVVMIAGERIHPFNWPMDASSDYTRIFNAFSELSPPATLPGSFRDLEALVASDAFLATYRGTIAGKDVIALVRRYRDALDEEHKALQAGVDQIWQRFRTGDLKLYGRHPGTDHGKRTQVLFEDLPENSALMFGRRLECSIVRHTPTRPVEAALAPAQMHVYPTEGPARSTGPFPPSLVPAIAGPTQRALQAETILAGDVARVLWHSVSVRQGDFVPYLRRQRDPRKKITKEQQIADVLREAGIDASNFQEKGYQLQVDLQRWVAKQMGASDDEIAHDLERVLPRSTFRSGLKLASKENPYKA